VTGDAPVRHGCRVSLRIDDVPPRPSHSDPFWVVHRGIFEGYGYGYGYRCMVCGRRGHGGGTWWQACAVGHPFECPAPGCDRVFSSRSGLAAHARWIGTTRHRTETP
jgi:hypothetical protein